MDPMDIPQCKASIPLVNPTDSGDQCHQVAQCPCHNLSIRTEYHMANPRGWMRAALRLMDNTCAPLHNDPMVLQVLPSIRTHSGHNLWPPRLGQRSSLPEATILSPRHMLSDNSHT